MTGSSSSTGGSGAGGENGTAHGGNSTQGGGGHGGGMSPAMIAMFAARQKVNERQMKYFAAGLSGLIAMFVILHWTRYLYSKVTRRSVSPAIAAPFAAVTRAIRRRLIRKFPRMNSSGHALLVTAYVGINCAVLFTNVDLSNMGHFAARAGWLTTSNMAFVVFLSLKNTPLAFLTAYSYERLNCLHQISGCLTFLLMVVHAACYTSYFAKKDKLSILREKEQVAGILAGFAFLSVVFSALVFRRFWYELFYVVHLAFFIVGIVSVCFHQPTLSKKIVIVLFSTAAMWVLDRLLRASRALYNLPNNFATVHPLPSGGTKVVFKKVPARAVPGKHFFVWFPSIRLFEMHPFTIVGTQPLEFIIKSHNGFTRDLHRFALKHPGAALRASLDGPYGTFPDPMEYDKIVLIAGGGGASFTFGLIVNLLEKLKESSNKSIDFIWTVKQHDNLAWFTQHLETLHTEAKPGLINIKIFVSRAPVSPEAIDIIPQHHRHEGRDESTPENARQDRHHRALTVTTNSESGSSSISPILPTDTEKPIVNGREEVDIEKEMQRRLEATEKAALATTAGQRTSVIIQSVNVDPEQTGTQSPRPAHRIASGRPDTATLIREAVLSANKGERVLVAACGPEALMTVVRNTTANLIKGGGPGVELHCEQFGW